MSPMYADRDKGRRMKRATATSEAAVFLTYNPTGCRSVGGGAWWLTSAPEMGLTARLTRLGFVDG